MTAVPRSLIVTVCILLALASVVAAQQPAARPHVIVTDPTWADAPPSLPKGAKLAILSGEPGSAGPYVLRLKMPAGYKVAPHWHPVAENVTVISGTFLLGMGDKFDETSMKEMATGSFTHLPAEMRHYAMAKTEVILQAHGVGPFAINYVNPADDPSKQQKTP